MLLLYTKMLMFCHEKCVLPWQYFYCFCPTMCLSFMAALLFKPENMKKPDT